MAWVEEGTHNAPPEEPLFSRIEAPPAVEPPPARVSARYAEAPPILGIEAVQGEDRDRIQNLMLFALTIKCTNGDYDSFKYERAVQWRIETRESDYLLLLLGWTSINYREMMRIWGWDTQPPDARNITNVMVTDAPLNDNPQKYVRTLVIEYLSEKEKRRRMAQHAQLDGDTAGETFAHPRKRRGLLGAAFDFITNSD